MTALLVTQDDEIAAHWLQVFPSGRCVSQTGGSARLESANLIWLHVGRDLSASVQQLMALQRFAPEAMVVGLADVPTDEQALALMERGIAGYCHSRAAPEMLQQVAAVVENRGLWVGESLLNRLIRGAAALPKMSAQQPEQVAELTPREIEVTESVLRGLSNKEIARELAITERTVKAHLSAIFAKVGVRDRLHLALKFSPQERDA